MTFEYPTSPGIQLPGGRDGRTDRERLFTFSVIVTGRCNVACTYCHYYLDRSRASVAYDISDEQYGVYLRFIQHWREQVGGHVEYRFSGGDPMVLGKRLFTLADRGFEFLGVKPFVLTAGKALAPHWAEKARKHAIKHLFVSIENPFTPDPGAPDPIRVAEAIKQCHTDEMPVLPGVCVVQNESFSRLFDICCWFFDRLGSIPIMSEVNFNAYCPPTEVEWKALEVNMEQVVREFHGKTPLKLFPYVSPELSFGGHDPYIFDLDLENSYRMTAENYQSKLSEFLRRLDQENYPSLKCPERQCNWWEFCDNTKWFWQGDRQNQPEQKLHDYCRFKRILNDVYFRILVDSTHQPTRTAIDAAEYLKSHGAERHFQGRHLRVLSSHDGS